MLNILKKKKYTPLFQQIDNKSVASQNKNKNKQKKKKRKKRKYKKSITLYLHDLILLTTFAYPRNTENLRTQ